MAIYIPGWYEQMAKAGSIPKLAGAISERVAPDFNANRRLQEMLQQNPMLLSQIENMTPEARAGMEQTLGFKNKNPLQSLPVGAQLKQQMADANYIETLTPEQKETRQAARVGTLTSLELQRRRTEDSQRDQKFQADLTNGTLQNQILTGQAKEVERIGSDVARRLAKYPTLKGIDINKIVKDTIRSGALVDPDLIGSIQSDPGAKQLFDIAYTVELSKFKNELDTRLAKTKSSTDEMQLLKVLTEMGNQLNDQQGKILLQMQADLRAFDEKIKNPLVSIQYMNNPGALDKARAEAMSPYQTQIDSINKAIQDNRFQVQKLSEKFGAVPVPKNETTEERAARLRKVAGGM